MKKITQTQIRKKQKDEIFDMKTRKKEQKKYRCLVMTMTARVNLIATRSTNPASSPIMLTPINEKSNTHKIKKLKNNEN